MTVRSLLVLLFAASTLSAAEPAPPAGKDVVARIGDRTVTLEEVLKSAEEQLDQVELQLAQCQNEYQRNRHQVVEAFTRDLVRRELVNLEAKARKVSPEEILASAKPKEVTQAEIDAFYEENKGRIPPQMTKEQVVPQIRDFLSQQSRATALEALYTELEKTHRAAVLLEPLRADVAATGPSKGAASAPVTIVEFSDFQCPFCRTVNPSLDRVQKEFGDQVRIVFRQYPLTAIHPHAQKAAEASLCADEQGKFWAMHDAMFADQAKLSPPDLKAKAAELKLDTAKFNSCLDTGKFAARVQTDLSEGTRAGVTGTPAIFVNGRFLSGAVPFEEIAALVRDEISRRAAKSASAR